MRLGALLLWNSTDVGTSAARAALQQATEDYIRASSLQCEGAFCVLLEIGCKVHSVIGLLSQCIWVACSMMRNVATFCWR